MSSRFTRRRPRSSSTASSSTMRPRRPLSSKPAPSRSLALMAGSRNAPDDLLTEPGLERRRDKPFGRHRQANRAIHCGHLLDRYPDRFGVLLGMQATGHVGHPVAQPATEAVAQGLL